MQWRSSKPSQLLLRRHSTPLSFLSLSFKHSGTRTQRSSACARATQTNPILAASFKPTTSISQFPPETVACAYTEFPDHFGFFLPLAGITTVKQVRESSF